MGIKKFKGWCKKKVYKNIGLKVNAGRVIVCFTLMASPLVSAVEVIRVKVVDGKELIVDGSGFGERFGQAAPVLMDFAEYAYENGVLNEHHAGFSQGQPIDRIGSDPNTLWVKPSVGSSSEGSSPRLERLASDRLASSDAHYLMEGANSWLGWPSAYGGFETPVDNQQLYVSWYMKPKYDPRWYWSTTPLNQNGQFLLGESVAINGIDGTFIGESDAGISSGMLVFILPGQRNANNLAGQKLVGLESGAEITFHPDFAGSSGVGFLSPGSNKYLRVWEDSSGREGVRLSWTNGQITQSGFTTSENSFSAEVIPGKWNFMELFIDLNAGKAIAKVNGIKDFEEVFGADKDLEGSGSPTIALLGLNGKIQVLQKMELDDIYMDHRFSRIFIGNKPNFRDLDSYNLQIPVEWSDNQIKFKPGRNGVEFTEAAYLYIINEDGEVNELGFPLCTICGNAPNPPPGVQIN
jgi:hypothetical protein